MATMLDKAKKALGEAEQRLARAEAELAAKTAERADLQARAGVEVLDNPSAAERTATALMRLTAALDVAERTVVAARARVESARPLVLRARAAELRDEAAKLRTEAAVRQRQTDRLLEQLREHEGVPYGIAPAPSADGVARMPIYPYNKTAVMLGRAAGLDEQAAALTQLAETGSDEARAARVAVLVAA